MQMARLIQAVVNNATNNADLHVEFNAPNIMSINLPVHVMTAAVHPGQARPATGNAENVGGAGAVGEQTNTAAAGAATAGAGAGAAAAAGVGTASTSSGTRSGEQRANTLPTTATQTRSTARPQIQIGGNNNWAGRIAPTHTAFDRFLPCNSHHIREPEPLPQQNNNNASSSSSSNGTNQVNSNNQANGSSSSTRRAASNATGEFILKSWMIHTHTQIHTHMHTSLITSTCTYLQSHWVLHALALLRCMFSSSSHTHQRCKPVFLYENLVGSF